MLVSYLKDHQLLKVNHVTPYGYRIDFVLHFDKDRKPVAPPRDDQATSTVTSSQSSLTTTNDSINKLVVASCLT